MRYTKDTSSGFRQPAAHYLASLVADRNFTEALRFYENHRAELDTLSGPDAGRAFNQLAVAANGLARYREALKFARRAQHAVAARGDSELLAEIFLTMGNSLRQMGEMKQAEQAFRDAESIFRRADSDDGRSRALNLLAGLFFRQNNFANAQTALLDAIELVRRRNDSRQLAFMLGNLGRIYSFMGNFGEAEKHLRTNIELSEHLNDRLEECRARLSLGYLFIQKAELAQAETELDHAYRLTEALDAHREQVMCLTYMGELQYRSQKYDVSRRTLDSALRLANEIGNDSVLTSRVLRHQAELAVRTGEYRLASRKASGAMVIMERVESTVEIGALVKIQAIIAAADKNVEQAGRLFSQAIETLGESGVRFEKADALVAAGSTELFSARERLTYLFRAEEFFSRSHLARRLDEVERMISSLDTEHLAPTPKRRRAGDSEKQSAGFVTANDEIRQFARQLPRIAESDLPLLLTGETGVGKDHMARYFHSLARPDGPYMAINCASVPESLLESELFGYRRGAFTGADNDKEGLFVAANGGVLFLDEIGDMPLALQGKLLGVLESRTLIPLGSTQQIELDVKLVAATNQSLEEMVEQGRFRRDLYYRLSGMVFRIPSLRERKEDIPLLLGLFMKQRGLLKNGETVSADLVRQFVGYDWPGNTRELYNKVKRLAIMAEMAAEGDLKEIARGIFPDDGPPAATQHSFNDRVEQFERKLLIEALLATNGNKSEAARMLGIHEATVRTKMKRYDITLNELRAH